MKKLFISIPTKGRSEKNIAESKQFMHTLAEVIFGEKLELVNEYVPNGLNEVKNQELFTFASRICYMSTADYFIGFEWTIGDPQCQMEIELAERFNIPSYTVYTWKYLKTFEDWKEILKANNENGLEYVGPGRG